jgi:hypothetical protein
MVPRQAAAPVAYRAAAAAAAVVPQQQQPVDVFYDADEVVPGSTLDLLMRELREAKEAREQTNRCGFLLVQRHHCHVAVRVMSSA